jgi:small-conductance mechanosensitive channel
MQTFLDNEYVRSIFSFILILAIFSVLYFLLDFILVKTFKKMADRSKNRLDDLLFRIFDKFLFRFVLLGALFYLNKRFSVVIPGKITFYINEILLVLLTVFIVHLSIRIINDILDWYLGRISQKTQTNIQKEFGPLIKRVLQVLIVFMGIIALLSHWHIDIKGLVVSLGVGSLAIALAAQETLANMIAGFVLMLDRPFRIGDRIKLGSGLLGDVYEIGLRSTKILDFENNLHIIPNHDIMKNVVVNLSYPEPRVRVRIDVGVAYGSDIPRVKEIIAQQFRNHPKILKDPEPKVYFVNFGDSSLDLMAIGFVQEYKDAWTTGEEIRIAVYEAFEKEGIEIPFPQTVVHLSNPAQKG